MLTGSQEPANLPLHVLLAEDDDNHAVIILRTLHRHSLVADVDRVRDGEEVLTYLRAEGRYANKPLPDLVLLDLKIPKIDGHEVLEQIKQDPHLRPIPTVILSTSDTVRDRAKAYRRQANSYLVKPADFAKFRELLDDLITYWGVWNKPITRRET